MCLHILSHTNGVGQAPQVSNEGDRQEGAGSSEGDLCLWARFSTVTAGQVLPLCHPTQWGSFPVAGQ